MSSPFPDQRHRKRPKKRRLPWVLLGLVLALLLTLGTLAILRPWGEVNETAQSAPLGALDAVSVSGRAGATPVISLARPLTVGALKFRVLENGEGRDIISGSPVLLSLTSFDGTSGASKSPRGRPRLVVGHAHPEALGVDLASLVIGQKEGARIVTIRPLGSQADGTTPTEITVIDILATSANGNENTGEDMGPLQVEMTADGPLVSHGASVPTGTSVQTLIRGDGPQVREHDRVVAQYAVFGWSDSLVRSSTWLNGMPQLIPLDSTMKGLSEALVDRRVGSRLAITVPPDLATGDDTLCIVVDVLGTEPAGEDGLEAEDSSSR